MLYRALFHIITAASRTVEVESRRHQSLVAVVSDIVLYFEM